MGNVVLYEGNHSMYQYFGTVLIRSMTKADLV